MASDVVVLTDGGDLGRAIVHAVQSDFAGASVIVESSVSRVWLVRRRVRRLGFGRVLGQLLFTGTVVPMLGWKSRGRIDRITNEYRLDLRPLPASAHFVPSVNSSACHRLLQELQPKVVVLAGTRIVAKATLARLVDAAVFNVHVGITPTYRGVHGAYWALWDGRPDLAGATVHLVDPGIDTGAVIAHCPITISPDDTFVTYPFLQIGVALPSLLQAIGAVLSGTPNAQLDTVAYESRMRTHPTIGEYLGGLLRGVK